MPEVASLPVKTISTGALNQVPLSGGRLGAPLTAVGAVASRLMVTFTGPAEPPALVAEQLNVVPAVSELMVVSTHPVSVTDDSGSVTVQSTTALVTYQPLLPFGAAG